MFRAFARTVATGEDEFVVVDTAPTGHTLLLLDATETYHREVSRGLGDAPDAVSRLLPRLRDPHFTRVLMLALPDATPVHEAMRLDADLRRADIRPFAWIVNQSFAACATFDPVLAARAAHELPFIDEVRRVTKRCVVLPWTRFAGAAHGGGGASRRLNSMRRLSARLASVSSSALGRLLPKPRMVSRSSSMPCATSQLATASARSSDSFKL